MEYFRNHRGKYVRKIKDRLHKHFNLFDGQLSQHSSTEECVTWKSKLEAEIARQQLFTPINPENSTSHLEKILLDAFSQEELKKGSNILFGTVIITMILDSNYQRGDIDSAELINRMNNWSGAPWIKKVTKVIVYIIY
jgi:hypothetical protein